MQILCIDVGAGTQDILLFDSEKNIENCVQLILPSWTALVAKQLRNSLSRGEDVLIIGTIMGGFHFHGLRDFTKSKGRVFATSEAAKTFHNNLERVKKMGVMVVGPKESSLLIRSGIKVIRARDIDLNLILNSLRGFSVEVALGGVAVTVQDHGEAPEGMSNRRFRFENIRKLLNADPGVFSLCFKKEEIPGYLTRMLAVRNSLKTQENLLLMDSGFAAILGSLEDPEVNRKKRRLVVNIGNGHTLGAYLKGNDILALFEHHTSKLNPKKLKGLLKKLATGTLSNEEIYQDGGHGAWVSEEKKNFGEKEIELISVTGPNRQLLDPAHYHYAATHGNMMLTGCFGLLMGYLRKFT
ncbi:MAG: pyruvate formate lyase-activating protein [Deltaproteobacteria bacterium]|nr:MAG: pyruvate formate lyase-activating protein [Deltaproteobacteria bacterium]